MDIAKESKRGSGTTVRGHWSLTRSSGKTSSIWGAVCSLCRLVVSAIDECWVRRGRYKVLWGLRRRWGAVCLERARKGY